MFMVLTDDEENQEFYGKSVTGNMDIACFILQTYILRHPLFIFIPSFACPSWFGALVDGCKDTGGKKYTKNIYFVGVIHLKNILVDL